MLVCLNIGTSRAVGGKTCFRTDRKVLGCWQNLLLTPDLRKARVCPSYTKPTELRTNSYRMGTNHAKNSDYGAQSEVSRVGWGWSVAVQV